MAREEDLRLLATDEDPYLRTVAARAPDCPPSLLALLAQDPVMRVRRTVASNPGCPVLVLELLARDSDINVRCGASQRLKVLERLAQGRSTST